MNGFGATHTHTHTRHSIVRSHDVVIQIYRGEITIARRPGVQKDRVLVCSEVVDHRQEDIARYRLVVSFSVEVETRKKC